MIWKMHRSIGGGTGAWGDDTIREVTMIGSLTHIGVGGTSSAGARTDASTSAARPKLRWMGIRADLEATIIDWYNWRRLDQWIERSQRRDIKDFMNLTWKIVKIRRRFSHMVLLFQMQNSLIRRCISLVWWIGLGVCNVINPTLKLMRSKRSNFAIVNEKYML